MTTAPVHPFVLFGEQHLLVMLIIISLTIAIPLIVKRMHSELVTRNVALSLAFALLVSKAGEPIFRILTGEAWPDDLPLHLCDIGGILAGVMLINRHYFLYELTYFWGLGGTLQAILTPDLGHGFPHIDFFFFFIAHGLVIVGVIYATVLFKYRPTLKSIWRTFATTFFYALLILPVNLILNTNYLYLCRKPPNPSLLDYLGPWPWYLLSLAVVGLIFFFIYYSPFWIADVLRKRRNNQS
ncbi:MAG: TIGR02206 family membrane protein [bacterium]